MVVRAGRGSLEMGRFEMDAWVEMDHAGEPLRSPPTPRITTRSGRVDVRTRSLNR
jgi:hypothetical protein